MSEQGYDVDGVHFNEWECAAAINAAVTLGLPTIFDYSTGEFITYE